MASPAAVAEEILAIYAARGAGAYFGERVSMTEHALQSAYFAQQAGAPAPLVIAALLHDIGHLLAQVPDDIADWTADARHEAGGARRADALAPRQDRAPVDDGVPQHALIAAIEIAMQGIEVERDDVTRT